MSSYVAVVGKPTGESVCIFGLTPQEVRYLQVCTYAYLHSEHPPYRSGALWCPEVLWTAFRQSVAIWNRRVWRAPQQHS